MKTTISASRIKFDECLNDLFDYFFVGDPIALLRFKEERGLADDLMSELTVGTTADEAAALGMFIPLSGIRNHPYTVYFDFAGDLELTRAGNDLQHREAGYVLSIESGQLAVFTVPFLRAYTPGRVDRLLEMGRKDQRPWHELVSGHYAVEIAAGQTQQRTGLEPTIEIALRSVPERPAFTADINHAFVIRAGEY